MAPEARVGPLIQINLLQMYDFWIIVLALLVSGIGAYSGAYLKERGKNLATKNDIKDITDRIEEVKLQYSEHANLLALRRKVYEELAISLRVFLEGEDKLNIKSNFLDSYSKSWLWASDEVLQTTNNLLKLMQRKTKGEDIAQEVIKDEFTNCIMKMRQDAGFESTETQKEDYQFVIIK